MRDTLRAGLRHTFAYRVPATKLVPALFPEATEFQAMPRVFATGYLVGLVEWTCIQAVNPHLDWPREQTVGTRVDVSHAGPTPPGNEVGVEVELTAVDGRRLAAGSRRAPGAARAFACWNGLLIAALVLPGGASQAQRGPVERA
jgi:fluoroacetyl-CoA thioesterase